MMCAALTLPTNLTPDEARLACELEDRALAEAQERAALAINVRREVRRLVGRGLPLGAALTSVADDPRFPVSEGTARDIWYRRKTWAA